jgi:hypothetical protein
MTEPRTFGPRWRPGTAIGLIFDDVDGAPMSARDQGKFLDEVEALAQRYGLRLQRYGPKAGVVVGALGDLEPALSDHDRAHLVALMEQLGRPMRQVRSGEARDPGSYDPDDSWPADPDEHDLDLGRKF